MEYGYLFERNFGCRCLKTGTTIYGKYEGHAATNEWNEIKLAGELSFELLDTL